MNTYIREVHMVSENERFCGLSIFSSAPSNQLILPVVDDARVLKAVYKLTEAVKVGRSLPGDGEKNK